ncbi:hypothetical protein BJ508DRAFT_304116 [Ascobolus immersus RN42]|uniref:Uncharacterized protein n=1 Tax=Ascobolus immersus RN42 TaxID=1160509 RepID=A0A3N4IDS9_ASCIM|nr:hypothetical protein BJ508DRAFT_304116 [Ascobolus immersus RN42]
MLAPTASTTRLQFLLALLLSISTLPKTILTAPLPSQTPVKSILPSYTDSNATNSESLHTLVISLTKRAALTNVDVQKSKQFSEAFVRVQGICGVNGIQIPRSWGADEGSPLKTNPHVGQVLELCKKFTELTTHRVEGEAGPPERKCTLKIEKEEALKFAAIFNGFGLAFAVAACGYCFVQRKKVINRLTKEQEERKKEREQIEKLKVEVKMEKDLRVAEEHRHRDSKQRLAETWDGRKSLDW